MQIKPYTGKYVAAVSGGVDSVVMLDLLVREMKSNPKLKIVVAHFDHGIRADSHIDEELVRKLSKHHALEYHSVKRQLGSSASEEIAREARYAFLNKVKADTKSDAIITAHHQDDVIETALINLLRGSGRKGLSSLSSTDEIKRPLINFSKQQIKDYALANGLSWREDSTNSDTKYLRNYIRLAVVPKISSEQRSALIKLINNQADVNRKLDKELSRVLKNNINESGLSRLWFNSLDTQLSRELIASWFRQNGLADFDRQNIERLASDLKVLKAGKKTDVIHGWQVRINGADLALEHVER